MRRLRLGEPPWIVGHRGSLPEFENTLPAFRLAVADGADAVECDVQCSSDGELFVFHDETLARVAAGDGRRLAELFAEELSEVRLPLHGAAAPAGSIPTLTALLAALPDDFPINVELKSYGGWDESRIDRLLATLHGRGHVVVSTFDRRLLGQLRSAAPALPLSPLAEKLSPELEELAHAVDAWALHLGEAPAPRPLVHLPWPVLIFTVNSPQEATDLVRRGVAGLFTDFPGALRQALPAAPPSLGVVPPTVV